MIITAEFTDKIRNTSLIKSRHDCRWSIKSEAEFGFEYQKNNLHIVLLSSRGLSEGFSAHSVVRNLHSACTCARN